MKGKVFLAGAGPGDLELMTRKAYRLVTKADCLVYDRLVDPRVLTMAKDSCEKIYVGKMNRCHAMKQEEINRLLAKKAEEFSVVVRLKGGDPYVFGRGGEEAAYLKEQGVEFEVVPGISSCIAGPAYAGIPVTHRGISGGFHVVTAHNRRDELAEIDFAAMAGGDDTCIFLMGLSQLDEIAARLLAAGKPPDTKIAVVSGATLPSQKTVVSTLAGIREEMKKTPLPSPSLIIVGGVVALREDLNFFEHKELYGKKILLPMAGSGSSALSGRLTELGAEVHEVRTSRIVEQEGALDGVAFTQYQYILLTSKNAARIFFRQLRQKRIDIRSLSHITFAAVGQATKRCLEEYGIYDVLTPSAYHQDALFELLKDRIGKKDHILFPKVKAQKEELAEKLNGLCAVTVVPVYENIPERDMEMARELMENRFDMILFNCSSSVHFTMEQIKDKGRLSDAKIISIGVKTTQALKSYGIGPVIQAEKADFSSVLQTVRNEAGRSVAADAAIAGT